MIESSEIAKKIGRDGAIRRMQLVRLGVGQTKTVLLFIFDTPRFGGNSAPPSDFSEWPINYF